MSFNNEWRTCKWGDISTLEYGKALRDYKGNKVGYPVYGTNGLIGYTDNYLSNQPGVIVGRKGAYRGVHYSKSPFYVIDTAYFLKPTIKELDLKWAYYNLRNKDINNLDSGSAIPSTSRSDFYSLDVELPELNEQKEIANLLSALDVKIELNNAINNNLEEMTQALFKLWFVDFEFPNENGESYKSSGGEFEESELGLIPRGWSITALNNLCTIQNGFAFKSEDYVIDGIKVLRTLNIQDNGYTDEENLVYLPEQFYFENKFKNYRLKSMDTLLVMVGASVGKVGLVSEISTPALQNQNMWRFRSKNEIMGPAFIYNLVKMCSKVAAGWATGSAREFYRKDSFGKIRCIVPDGRILKKYNEIAASTYSQVQKNLIENKKIKDIRDALLPKLMSGEIRVPLNEENPYSQSFGLPQAAESKAQYSTI